MLLERQSECPWCWETIDLFVDTSVGDQQYVEDCSVCCRPIVIAVQRVGVDPEDVQLTVDREA